MKKVTSKEKEEIMLQKRKEDLLSGNRERRKAKRNLIILCVAVAFIICSTIFQRIYITIKGIPTHEIKTTYHQKK